MVGTEGPHVLNLSKAGLDNIALQNREKQKMKTSRKFMLTLLITVGAVMVSSFAQGGVKKQDLVDWVAELAGKVADLEAKTTLSDLSCQDFATFPAPLAIQREGQWDCAEFQFVRETSTLPAGTREHALSATCPAGSIPMSGGTSATRFRPPDSGALVLTNSGPGPSFDQWSANWVSLASTGTTFQTTVHVVLWCL